MASSDRQWRVQEFIAEVEFKKVHKRGKKLTKIFLQVMYITALSSLAVLIVSNMNGSYKDDTALLDDDRAFHTAIDKEEQKSFMKAFFKMGLLKQYKIGDLQGRSMGEGTIEEEKDELIVMDDIKHGVKGQNREVDQKFNDDDVINGRAMQMLWRMQKDSAIKTQDRQLDYIADDNRRADAHLKLAAKLSLYAKQSRDSKKGKIKNPHPFRYLLYPGNVCNNDLFILLCVHTAPEHHQARMLIRNTWGNQEFYDFKIRLLFFMGSRPNVWLEEALNVEQNNHGDIVQEDFYDSYRNLTYKFIAVLKYVSTNCKIVPFILKADDDSFVNLYSIAKHLRFLRTKQRKRLIMCLLYPSSPAQRGNEGKWSVSKEEWEEDNYPPYCSGRGLVMTADVAVAMHNASYYRPYFWIDDVLVTGVLAKQVGARHMQLRPHVDFNFKRFLYRYKTNMAYGMNFYLTHSHRLKTLRELWTNITKFVQKTSFMS